MPSLITWNVCLAVLAIMMAIAALGLFIFTVARDRLVLRTARNVALRRDSVWLRPETDTHPDHFLPIEHGIVGGGNQQIRAVQTRTQFINLETDGMASMMQINGETRVTVEPIYGNLANLRATNENNEITAEMIKSIYEPVMDENESEKEWGSSSSESSSRSVSVLESRVDPHRQTPLPSDERFDQVAQSPRLPDERFDQVAQSPRLPEVKLCVDDSTEESAC